MSGITYGSAGVNYDALDAFKRICQRAAGMTKAALKERGFEEVAGARGESAYLIEGPNEYWAHVEEGLGTKNLVADAMLKLTGRSFYRNIGIDSVATIVNDLITCGAMPVSVAMHAAVGDGKWFENATRSQDLAEGFAEGCRQANAVWGGGETPALKDIVNPEAIVLAGSAIGRIWPKSNRILGNVHDGDSIILLSSSGMHTNGLTLCRAIAERLPEGFLTKIGDGRTYGEALLDPSIIYVRFVEACQKAGIELHYVSHITGHGWRKLMRLEQPFVYRLTDIAKPLPIFELITSGGHVDQREAYATFNMGAGLATYVDPKQASLTIKLANDLGYEAILAGTVRKEGQRKAVDIEPLGIVFEGEELRLR